MLDVKKHKEPEYVRSTIVTRKDLIANEHLHYIQVFYKGVVVGHIIKPYHLIQNAPFKQFGIRGYGKEQYEKPNDALDVIAKALGWGWI